MAETETQQPQSFSLFDDPAVSANPFPFFAELRKNAPVVKLPGPGFWAVAKYDDVLSMLRDPETFSSRVDARSIRGEERPPTILFDDPPVHTRMRGLISKAFTPRTIELQRDSIQEYAEKLIDAMCEGESADYVASLAYPLPVRVIAGMLGVQDGDMATFKRWSDAIIENIGRTLLEGDVDALADINAEFDAYFKVKLAKLRVEPEDTLLSGLVHAETEDGRLSEEDLLVICRVLLVAGNETTTGLIVNCARIFSEFPEVLTRLKEDPSLIPTMIEETLRYYPPFPATFRRAMRDVEIRGVTIPAGDRILALLASANRDEEAFERADAFVIDRDPNRHVAFGMGIHFCLGAPLARLESNIAMSILVPRLTSLRIEESGGDTMLRPGGPKSLRVRFELDRSVAAAV